MMRVDKDKTIEKDGCMNLFLPIKEIYMKKNIWLLSSILLLVGCTRQEKVDDVQKSEDSTTSTQTESTTEISNTVDSQYPYAISSDEFTKKVSVEGQSDKMIYRKTFARSEEKRYPKIVINMRDVNDFGKGIYFLPINAEDEASIFYPISMQQVTTKEIEVVANDGSKRNVHVNTELTVETYPGNADTLEMVGRKCYLFRNNEGTLSLAVSKNDAWIEYVETSEEDSSNLFTEEPSAENPTPENPTTIEEKKAMYYDLIYQAWDRQRLYIESIEDLKVRQSVQTSHSAAIFESTRLMTEYPEDVDLIKEALSEVLVSEQE